MLLDRSALERATTVGVAISFLISLFAVLVPNNPPLPSQMQALSVTNMIGLALTCVYSFGGLFYGALYGAFATRDNPEMTIQDYVGGGALTGSFAQGIGALFNVGLMTLRDGIQQESLLLYTAAALIPFVVQSLIGFVLGSFGGRIYAAIRQPESLPE